MVDELVLITFTILLPITPAYILYKALPARASVRGPFKGLNIQLSGAFAGYFLLVLLIFGFHYSKPKSTYEVWEVRGQLKPTDGGSIKEGAVLSLIPSPNNVRADGHFTVTIATMPGLDGGVRFPQLHIEHPLYEQIDIDLNDAKPGYGAESCRISKSPRDRRLKLENALVFKRKETNSAASYDSSGQVAVPVSASEGRR